MELQLILSVQLGPNQQGVLQEGRIHNQMQGLLSAPHAAFIVASSGAKPI